MKNVHFIHWLCIAALWPAMSYDAENAICLSIRTAPNITPLLECKWKRLKIIVFYVPVQCPVLMPVRCERALQEYITWDNNMQNMTFLNICTPVFAFTNPILDAIRKIIRVDQCNLRSWHVYKIQIHFQSGLISWNWSLFMTFHLRLSWLDNAEL